MKEGNEVRLMMRQPTSSIEEEKKNQQEQQIQLKLSTIFKYKILDTPQAFGSFYDENGEKYCAVSVLSKYLGYDIAAGVSKKIRNYKKDTNTAELIPYDVLEMMENLVVYSNNEAKLKCFCSKPDYYYRHNLISLLIHLNDYHKMTFTQIGNWLENIVGFSVIILISKQRLLVTKIVKNQCKKHVLNVANTLNVLNQ